ncbi:MAG TPA: OmpA family protein, partial [Chitinophagales bacterium]
LNMNGYGRTAGLWGLNVASVKGLEAERLNPAGLAYTRNTEISVNYTSWLTGSGVSIVQAGFATRIKSNAIAVSVQAVNVGQIQRTTVAMPEGGIGTYSPTFFNLGVSYAKNFSLGSTALTGDNVITGGATFRFISEGITGLSSFGFAFDAGLQYTTGKKENIHFGVSLRNAGMGMKFAGDGLALAGAFDGTYSTPGGYSLQVNKNSNKFELPMQLNMGISYDVWLGAKRDVGAGKYTQNYRLTPMFQYSANAYGNDNFGPGLEFGLKEIFFLRAAYRMEPGIFKESTTATAYNGLAVGSSVNIPFKKDGTGASLGIDYAYRMTGINTNFTGTHTVGLRFNLGNPKAKAGKEEDIVTPKESAYEEESKTDKKATKNSKKTTSELVEKQALIDSLVQANEALKAQPAKVRVDTVKIIEKVAVPVELEKTDYKGGNIDTIVENGRTTLRFNDYDKIQFETNSTILSKSSTSYLNYLVNQMKLNQSGNLVLSGHTDNVGDDAANKKLSEDRANAVRDYIVSKGIDKNRITTYGFGADLPKFMNSSEAGRAKNRRVEVDIML